ncbi:hypothetical protein ACSSS7_000047 [Eimeria intestinalis]
MAGSEVGVHCYYSLCKQLDFLPFTCSLCGQSFCLNHRAPSSHDCAAAEGGPPKPTQQQEGSIEQREESSSNTDGGPSRGPQEGPPLDTAAAEAVAAAPAGGGGGGGGGGDGDEKVCCGFPGCDYRSVCAARLICCSSCSISFCLLHRHPEAHWCTATAAAEAAAAQQEEQQKAAAREKLAAALGPAAAARILRDTPNTPTNSSTSSNSSNSSSNSNSSNSSRKLSTKGLKTQQILERMKVKMRAKPDPSIPAASQLPIRVSLELLPASPSAAADAAVQQRQQQDKGICLVVDSSKPMGCVLDKLLDLLKLKNRNAAKGGPHWCLLLPLQQQQQGTASAAGASSSAAAAREVIDPARKAGDVLQPGDTIVLCPQFSSSSNSSSNSSSSNSSNSSSNSSNSIS